jgi:hypothetical protein
MADSSRQLPVLIVGGGIGALRHAHPKECNQSTKQL